MVLRWRAEEALDLLRDPTSLDLLLDEPLLVLDLLDGEAGRVGDLTRVPCPVVAVVRAGVTTQWPADLVLVEGAPDTRLLADDLDEAVERLARTESARAAGVLAQLLRATRDLSVDHALAMESLAYSLLLTGPDFHRWLADRPPLRPQQPDDHPVLVRRTGSLLELTLNRPDVRNAYNAATRDALVEALNLALLDPDVEKVVLRGNGPAFCSGGDLREFGTSADLVHAHGIRTTRHPGALLHALAHRTEVQVHGACVGAGVELPAFAGRVVARADARFRLPEVAMGTIPGAGGTVSLPRRIGAGRTLLLALSGVELTAPDALRWGLVDELRESDVPAQ